MGPSFMRRKGLKSMADFDAAFLTIRPLPTSDGQWNAGPNFWTATVPGWGISAPTVRELIQLLRAWFDDGETHDGFPGART